MKLKTFITYLVAISCLHGYAQNGITKYELDTAISSRPVGYYIHDSILYFSAVNTAEESLDLWRMDGTKPRIISKGAENGNFAYHYIAGGRADSLFLIVKYTGFTSGYTPGVYSFNLTTNSLRLLIGYERVSSGAYYKTANTFLYGTYTNGIWDVYRYNIDSGKAQLFANVGIDTAVIGIYHAHNRYYATCNYGINGNATTDIHVIDTINKSLDHRSILPARPGGVGYHMAELGGDIYFTHNSLDYGRELYKYSGSGSPIRLTDIYKGSVGSFEVNYSLLTVYRNKIYFYANSATLKGSLYEYDPLPNTVRLLYNNQNKYPYNFRPEDMYVHNDRLYMSGIDTSLRHQLYVYDGIGWPIKVTDLQPSYAKRYQVSDFPKFFTAYKGDLYFSANDSVDNVEMFRFNDSLLRPVFPQNIAKQATPFPITAYPNPAGNTLHLDITLQQAQTLSVAITDVQGRVVYHSKEKLYSQGSHTIDADITLLPAGTYIYTLADELGIPLNSGKVIKK